MVILHPVLPLLLASTILTINKAQPLARFDPRQAVGATIDAHDFGETAKILRRENVKAMLSAGFQPLAYRLATELCGEAWHWNPRGSWSDPEREEGYWTSSDGGPPIAASYGYRLPRRGNTLDQALNDDYSRVDDGDRATFWKSNPYLDSPQWLLADLGEPRDFDTIRIVWARPYAVEYELQRWNGAGNPLGFPIGGDWVAFEGGSIRDGHGGDVTHRIERTKTRWIRILMTHSAGGPETNDWRDARGFAVAELYVRDDIRDLIRHARSHSRQSVIWVSSTDPWHRAEDLDESLEQPGFDAVAASGLTRRLPLLTPVALLYGTPEDAAAEVRYLSRRGIPVTSIEMGEEPDGQNVSPEDYATLYLRWADALHAADPSLRLGGPAFQSTRDFVAAWPNARGETSWIGRFVAYLRARDRLDDFGFFSFEWYPVDDVCGDAQEELVAAPKVFHDVLARWHREGLPESVPLLVTEYGWSSFAAKEEMETTAALFNADFLAGGGAAAYLYGLEPEVPIRESQECATAGNLMLFRSDDERHILAKVPAYDAARVINFEWLQPSGEHELYRIEGTDELLRAWAVRRPDGTWSVLIINKDDAEGRRVEIEGKTIDMPPHSIKIADLP